MRRAERWSRRTFLQSCAGAAALLPLLSSGTARSLEAPFPKRIILVYSANGVLDWDWWPGAGGLAELPYSTAVLSPHASQLVFVDNLSLETAYADSLVHGGHDANIHMLTGRQSVPGGVGFDKPIARAAGGPSVDQFIAEKLAAETPFALPSLTLGVQVNGKAPAQARWVYANDGTPIAPQVDPAEVLRTVFSVGVPPEELDRIRAERRSILDLVGRDLQRFSAHLGSDDRQQVESHLAAVRELERQLDPALIRACAAPTESVPFDPTDASSFPKTAQLQMQVIAAAMACDLTRVATLQLGDSGGERLVFSWLDEAEHAGLSFPTGTFSGLQHHQIAHAAGGGENPATGDIKRRVDRWFSELFGEFINTLASYPEGDGTLLDNTALVWMNNMSNGAGHHMGRYRGGIPTVVAGSCGGAIRTGQHLTQGSSKVSHTRFLTSLCQAMDVPIEHFGDGDFANSALPGLLA